MLKNIVLIAAFAMVGAACAPAHHHHGMGPGESWHGHHFEGPGPCAPEACAYGSRCYSSGAIRANDGACQQCSAGKWMNASGCREHECDGCREHECAMMGKSKPCDGGHHGKGRGHGPPR